MATNNFKAFALDPNANVMSQADWEALPALLSGFTAGKASSAQVNKALRQSTTIAALVGQFIANSGADALDNADVNGLVTKFTNALTTNLSLGTASKRDVGTGSNQIPDMASFSSSLSSPGFQKLPSGLILQWGLVSGASSYTVTFPVSFPRRTLILMAIPHTTSAAGVTSVGLANCSDLGTSKFYIIVGKINQGAMVEFERSCFWFAVGI